MRHPRILAGLLALVGVFSIGFGVQRLCFHQERRHAFEQHVADICVQAAMRANQSRNSVQKQ